jgi:CheY-like chemotaxis protein
VELIRKSLDAGVVFHYGLIMDVTTRRIADLRQELDFIIGTPDITLPGYLVPPIPILGTPFFNECLSKGIILPETKLRDLDSVTLSLRPLDPIDEVADFFRNIQGLYGYRSRLLRHSLGFYKRYRSKLTNFQMMVALNSSLLLCAERLITSCSWTNTQRKRRHTHISTREPLDDAYTPAFCVDSRYEDYFKPTMVTDKAGHLIEDLAEDLLCTPAAIKKTNYRKLLQAIKEDLVQTVIMVVDDEFSTRETLKGVLEDRGYQVDVAEDGLTAIEMAKKTHFDIMFIDVVMPGIDGFKTLEEIKKIDPKTKVIMMTGHDIEDFVDKAVSRGAFTHMSKPIDMVELLQLTTNATEK